MRPIAELVHLPQAHGVYRILCTANSKSYVGSTSRQTIRARCVTHRRELARGTHCNRHLSGAWAKYGALAFRFEALMECEPDECLEAEQYWIDKLDAAERKYGFNLNRLATSCRGTKQTPQHRAKISAALKGRKHTPEVLARITEGNRRRGADPEHRKKLSVAQRQRLANPAEREKIATATRAAMDCPAMRERLSRAATNHSKRPGVSEGRSARMRELWADPDYRAKIMEARRKAMTPEAIARLRPARQAVLKRVRAMPGVKAKMAEKNRRFWADPAQRAKIAAHMKGKRRTPEQKALLAEAARQQWADTASRAKKLEGMRRNLEARRAAREAGATGTLP